MLIEQVETALLNLHKVFLKYIAVVANTHIDDSQFVHLFGNHIALLVLPEFKALIRLRYLSII